MFWDPPKNLKSFQGAVGRPNFGDCIDLRIENETKVNHSIDPNLFKLVFPDVDSDVGLCEDP